MSSSDYWDADRGGVRRGLGVHVRARGARPGVVGDMATARVAGEFALVYVVWNSIGNVRTQAEQVATFRNAARRVADWHGAPFTTDSESHVSLWRRPGPDA